MELGARAGFDQLLNGALWWTRALLWAKIVNTKCLWRQARNSGQTKSLRPWVLAGMGKLPRSFRRSHRVSAHRDGTLYQGIRRGHKCRLNLSAPHQGKNRSWLYLLELYAHDFSEFHYGIRHRWPVRIHGSSVVLEGPDRSSSDSEI